MNQQQQAQQPVGDGFQNPNYGVTQQQMMGYAPAQGGLPESVAVGDAHLDGFPLDAMAPAQQTPVSDPFAPEGAGFFDALGGYAGGDGQGGVPPQVQQPQTQPPQGQQPLAQPFQQPQFQQSVPAPQFTQPQVPNGQFVQAPQQGAPQQGAPQQGTPQPLPEGIPAEGHLGGYPTPQQGAPQGVPQQGVPQGFQNGPQTPPAPQQAQDPGQQPRDAQGRFQSPQQPVQQTAPQQGQPAQLPAMPERPVLPEAPTRPTRPENFNRLDAETDPDSESARYLQAEFDWQQQMGDFLQQQATYPQQVAEYERQMAVYNQGLQQHVVADAQRYGLNAQQAADFFQWASNPANTQDMRVWVAAYQIAQQQAAQQMGQRPTQSQFQQQPVQGYAQPVAYTNGYNPNGYVPQAPPPAPSFQPQMPVYATSGYPQQQAPAQPAPQQRQAFAFPPSAAAMPGAPGVSTAPEDVLMNQMLAYEAGPRFDF